jgi:hypothetical protein
MDQQQEPNWTKSKWTHADLNDQDVEFEFPLKDGRWIAGLGKFLVSENPQGLLDVQIRVVVEGDYWPQRRIYDFQLASTVVDCIDRKPEGFQAKIPRS